MVLLIVHTLNCASWVDPANRLFVQCKNDLTYPKKGCKHKTLPGKTFTKRYFYLRRGRDYFMFPCSPIVRINSGHSAFVFSVRKFEKTQLNSFKNKTPLLRSLNRFICGEGGIRTRGTLRYTNFPSLHVRPLWHLSGFFGLQRYSNQRISEKNNSNWYWCSLNVFEKLCVPIPARLPARMNRSDGRHSGGAIGIVPLWQILSYCHKGTKARSNPNNW